MTPEEIVVKKFIPAQKNEYADKILREFIKSYIDKKEDWPKEYFDVE